jgi:hypothetical protein
MPRSIVQRTDELASVVHAVVLPMKIRIVKANFLLYENVEYKRLMSIIRQTNTNNMQKIIDFILGQAIPDWNSILETWTFAGRSRPTRF